MISFLGQGVTELSPLEFEIKKLIKSSGPMPVWRYMELCLMHPQHGYYLSRDPLGREGDFTTAPEVSQMSGELPARGLGGFPGEFAEHLADFRRGREIAHAAERVARDVVARCSANSWGCGRPRYGSRWARHPCCGLSNSAPAAAP